MEAVVQLRNQSPIVKRFPLQAHDPPHRRKILRRRVTRRELGNHRLKRPPRLKHRRDPSHPRLRLLKNRRRNRLRDHIGPPGRTRTHLNDTRLGEHLDRLTQGRPTHPHTLRQLPFRRKPIATMKLPRPNRISDLRDHSLKRPPRPNGMETLNAHNGKLIRPPAAVNLWWHRRGRPTFKSERVSSRPPVPVGSPIASPIRSPSLSCATPDAQ